MSLSPEGEILAAYEIVYHWLESARLDHPTAVLLSDLLAHLADGYRGFTGRGVGEDWAP